MSAPFRIPALLFFEQVQQDLAAFADWLDQMAQHLKAK